MSGFVDLYAMLGVAHDADVNAIRQAIALHHSAGTVEAQYLEAAKKVLLNAENRAKYDAKRAQTPAGQVDEAQLLAQKKADERRRYEAMKAARGNKQATAATADAKGISPIVLIGLVLFGLILIGMLLPKKGSSARVVTYPHAETFSEGNNDILLLKCQDLAKEKLNHPATFDYEHAKDNGVLVLSAQERALTMTFTAKNSFGVPDRFQAVCSVVGSKITLIAMDKK